MPAYAIFDVEIHDMALYGEFMQAVKPALEAMGARYLVRGGEHRVYEGNWEPRRLVIIEAPSIEAFERFYHSEHYQSLKSIRDRASTARLVAVEGLP